MSRIADEIIGSFEEAIADRKGKKTKVQKRVVLVPTNVDIKAVRRKLKMSQRQFADRFGFSLGTLQNWERGHRRPEGAARILLTVISQRPEAVLEALASQ